MHFSGPSTCTHILEMLMLVSGIILLCYAKYFNKWKQIICSNKVDLVLFLKRELQWLWKPYVSSMCQAAQTIKVKKEPSLSIEISCLFLDLYMTDWTMLPFPVLSCLPC